MTELTISEARKGFLALPKKLARMPGHALTVTLRGKPSMVIMPSDLFESIVETLDILGDPDAMADLRESIEDIKHGRLIDHEEVGRRLGL
jgi:PHD/YefM family antitoxin component YafN of YafNO toxin-antitoxin module